MSLVFMGRSLFVYYIQSVQGIITMTCSAAKPLSPTVALVSTEAILVFIHLIFCSDRSSRNANLRLFVCSMKSVHFPPL